MTKDFEEPDDEVRREMEELAQRVAKAMETFQELDDHVPLRDTFKLPADPSTPKEVVFKHIGFPPDVMAWDEEDAVLYRDMGELPDGKRDIRYGTPYEWRLYAERIVEQNDKVTKQVLEERRAKRMEENGIDYTITESNGPDL